ncbi:hypothetical protein pb186bvf_001998 [Paramecium bursaria]
MDRKLMMDVFNESLILYNISIGIQIQEDVLVLVIINIIITILVSIALLYQQIKNFHPKIYLLKYFRIILIGVQIGIVSNQSQFSIFVICFLYERNDFFKFIEIKLFALGTLILLNLTQRLSENFLEQPQTLTLLVLVVLFQIVTLHGYKKQMYLKEVFDANSQKNVDMRVSKTKTPDIIQQKDLSIRSDNASDLNGMQEISSSIRPNEDIIMQSMSWIQNLSAIVFNQDLKVVFQSLFLGKLMKNQGSWKGLDLETIFLDTQIIVGSKELNEVPSQSQLNESEISDDGGIVNDYQRCKMKQHFTVKDLFLQTMAYFDKWRFFTITLYQMKNQYLEFTNLQIKTFVQEIQGKKYMFFIFESQAIIQKSTNLENNLQIVNVFTTFIQESINYLNCILTLILLMMHEKQESEQLHQKHKLIDTSGKFSNPMRMVSIRFNIFLNSMRDYIFYMQNQLFLRISSFKISDLVDDILIIYEDNLKLRDISMTTSIDLQDNNQIIFSDFERVKQILSCLLSYCLKYTSAGQLKLDIKSFTQSGILVSVKDSLIASDEVAKKTITQLIKNLNAQLKKQNKYYELDLGNPLELQICMILCYQLSGTFKRGLEFIFDQNGHGSFTFCLESQNQTSKASHSNPQDAGPIKILGQKKYYETSLSMILALDSSFKLPYEISKEESQRQFSQTFFSKQLSRPGGEFDINSAHFSQISKINKQDTSNSRAIGGSNPKQSNSFSGTGQQQHQDTIIQHLNAAVKTNRQKVNSGSKSESGHESMKTQSAIDFGFESSTRSIHPPELNPKLLNTVIKYRLRTECCSKVLIVDNDHYSVYTLQLVLGKYNIKCDKAFNGVDAQQKIDEKERKPCHCKNKSYLLYFIELNLPILTGVELVKYLKENMKVGSLDKGFAIAMSTFVDLNSKLDSFRNGMDYFICKPFDLLDISAAVQYLDY